MKMRGGRTKAAGLRLRSRPKAAGAHRMLEPSAANRLFDAESWLKPLVRKTALVLDKPFGVPTYVMKIAMPGIAGLGDSMGKGLTREQAYASCIAESAERICCSLSERDELLEASFRELGAAALSPAELGVFRGGCYSASLPIDWVKGWNLTRRKRVLVPAMCGLYISRSYGHRYYRQTGPKTDYTYSDSNGCSAGSCLEEAVLHGMLELIERDSLMICARNGLRMPELDAGDIVKNTDNPGLAGLLGRLLAAPGVEVRFKLLTLNLKVCVAACVVIDRRAHLVTAGYGAHLDLSTALSRALTEAFQARALNQLAKTKASARQFHEFLSGRLDYLCGQGRRLRFRDVRSVRHADILEDVEYVLRLLSAAGSEVIVVDRSPAAGKISVVKVLVTGLQRVDWANLFGTRLLATDKGERVLRLPSRLGLRAGGRTLSDLDLSQLTFY